MLARAIELGCANGSVTRAEVRAQLRRVNFPAKSVVLSVPISFSRNGDIQRRRFGIFRITANGAYAPVG